MPHPHFTKPLYIFFLILPSGISTGFITVVMPYLLTQNGFPVALTAGIVAVGLSANLWRFLWGPIVDISLSSRKWYWTGLLACTATLLLLCFVPFTVKGATLLTIIVFVSQVAATIILLPINNIMARAIAENHKGKASGFYQAGSLTGNGIAGGLGLWIATQCNVQIAGLVLCIVSFLPALVIMLIRDIPRNKKETIVHEIKVMGKDILAMLKVPAALFVMILVAMPIGSGAMANLWSAIANDWKANLETVLLVTGVLGGLISALGCIFGGFVADRFGIWFAYLGTGILCAVVTLIMALMPMEQMTYIWGVLIYNFCMGMIYAAFTAVVLYAVGKKHVATKFSLIASLGNLPVVYVTSLNGWVHDAYNSKIMLITEAFVGMIFVVIFYLILKQLQRKNLIPVAIE